MKTHWIKTSGLILLSAIFTIGMNAQPQGGRNWTRAGQGDGPGRGYHQGQGFHQRQGAGQGRGYMAQRANLDLTEEQKEQLKALRLEHHKTIKPLKNKMLELKASERTLMSEESVDLKKVNANIDEQTELAGQLKKLQAAHRVEMREVFTEEQLFKLDQLRQGKKSRRAKGPGMHHRPGRGYHRNMG